MDRSFINYRLIDAVFYDRIAGHFRSSRLGRQAALNSIGFRSHCQRRHELIGACKEYCNIAEALSAAKAFGLALETEVPYLTVPLKDILRWRGQSLGRDPRLNTMDRVRRRHEPPIFLQ